MTYKKITEELIEETKDPVVVEHKKSNLEKEKESVLADKERQIATADERISRIDAMLDMFS